MLGKTVSHYKILEMIGSGGMGTVYKALDLRLDRYVALKFLPPHLSRADEAKMRFIHEAKAASALDHPNICTIYEIGETGVADDLPEGQLFIAMAFYEGKTLKDIIRKEGLPIDDTVDYTLQIACGLTDAHEKDIIHRDIKPANILITNDGKVKILDFGLAKLAGQTVITREGSTLGTVSYMSPEQTRGTDVDHRTDIWSLGIVLYEMLTGEKPFKGDYEQAVMYAIMSEDPQPIHRLKQAVPAELQQIIRQALRKDPEVRYSSVKDMADDLKKYQITERGADAGGYSVNTLIRSIRRPKILVPLICTVVIALAFSVWFFNHQEKVRWAREIALPEIERLVEVNWRDFTEPYKLAEIAEQYIPDDARLKELISISTVNMPIASDPQGANVYVKKYNAPEDEWGYLGTSPLDSIRMPIGIFRWKFEKPGYDTVYAAASSWGYHKNERFMPYHLFRQLDKTGSIPAGMVRVAATETAYGKLDDFFIDKMEVTNHQYQMFINSGGYQKKEYWKHTFLKDGRVLNWDEAMELFVDQIGRPGPSTWLAGDYPEGQDNYPVSGISWYEAAAYAEFVGKHLPTLIHWGIARGELTPMIEGFQMGGDALIVPFSNFGSDGPVETGILPGTTAYGAHDMAGNVREWCLNETPIGRVIRGGSWEDNSYMFGNITQAPAFDRSPGNGFRCALYLSEDKIPASVFNPVELGEDHDFYQDIPVSDNVFNIYKEQFSYDRTELKAEIIASDSSANEWIEERITFDAAYGDERMIAILFRPKNYQPPYQTVVYFPGSQAFWRESSVALGKVHEFRIFLSFIVKNGRAVIYPIYKGTMERKDKAVMRSPRDSYRRAEFRINVVKDFRRCLDYLATRPDIDSDKLAYYGMSWGGNWPAALILAVEDRLRTAVLLAGGLIAQGRQEVRPVNYITRVRLPVLMLNGRYDSQNYYDKSITPMYDLLGTPSEHKVLKLYDTDHIPPKNEFIKEILNWLDKYLGPVR